MIGFVPLAAETVLRARYTIHDLLGKGGMGAVYLAEDMLSGEEVAVKQTFYGDNEELSRAFYHEAKLLARLKHPALPKVTDYFAENNSQFLVMELIHGKDLSSSFDQNGKCEPLSFEDAIELAEQLFEVLAYLHAQNIVHRDLKPANLKLTATGQLKVLDFGAAKGSLTETTIYSVPVHTPGYAPPEQIYHLGTDERSDVFSAAATIYHLLAGEPPPSASKRENIIRTKKIDPLRPLHELNAKVLPFISEVLQKAMSLAAEDRYTADEALQKLKSPPIQEIEDIYAGIARILDLIATKPNAKEDDFGVTYFDGGQVNYTTGITEFLFTDGIVAYTSSTSGFADLSIKFPSGVSCRIKGTKEANRLQWNKERVAFVLTLLATGKNPDLDAKYGSPANLIDVSIVGTGFHKFVDGTDVHEWVGTEDKSGKYFVEIFFEDVQLQECKEVFIEIEGASNKLLDVRAKQ